MSDEIDRAIEGAETIVRGVCTPYHYDVKKKKLRKNAFKPRTPSTGVSVFRGAVMDSKACKTKAAGLSGDGKAYVGLAALDAQTIRSTGATVEDSRELFYGHADVFVCAGYLEAVRDHVQGDPLPPQIQEVLDDRVGKLIDAAVFHLDPNPTDEGWNGPDPLLQAA
uniref:hypothetical protein n=1 Tax=Burkholderia anthina TaxID=179879 RepID=UPI00158906DF|nr:hypothetical protein [Burkholderia anthina]